MFKTQDEILTEAKRESLRIGRMLRRQDAIDAVYRCKRGLDKIAVELASLKADLRKNPYYRKAERQQAEKTRRVIETNLGAGLTTFAL